MEPQTSSRPAVWVKFSRLWRTHLLLFIWKLTQTAWGVHANMLGPMAVIHWKKLKCAVSVTTCTNQNSKNNMMSVSRQVSLNKTTMSHYSEGLDWMFTTSISQHFKGQVCVMCQPEGTTHDISVRTAPLRRSTQKKRVCDLLNVTHASYSWQTWHKHRHLWLLTPPHQGFHSLIENKSQWTV